MTGRARLAGLALAALAIVGSARAADDRPATTAELDAAIAGTRTELGRAGSDAARTALEHRLANLWVLRARVDREAGRVDAALDGYDQALIAEPGHVVALVEAGFLQLSSGRPERARSLAETALAHAPDDPYAHRLRGEILYRDNRLQDALDDFTAAARRAPDDRELGATIAKVKKELAVERDYRRADSSHFELRFDGARDEALRTLLLDVLERQLDDLRRDLDVSPLPPVSVILYTSKVFHETTGTPEEVVGLYDGKVRLPVGGVREVSPALVRVVRHELTHALLHARTRNNAPRWLHEGFAQLMEPRDAGRARTLVLKAGASDPAKIGLEPFSYPTAFSFVAWLDATYGRTRLLWFVDLLGAQRTEDDALLEAFGTSKDDLVRSWARSLSARP